MKWYRPAVYMSAFIVAASALHYVFIAAGALHLARHPVRSEQRALFASSLPLRLLAAYRTEDVLYMQRKNQQKAVAASGD